MLCISSVFFYDIYVLLKMLQIEDCYIIDFCFFLEIVSDFGCNSIYIELICLLDHFSMA
jgi:hypothetical protein